MEIGKTFCGRTDVRTDGRTHLSSNLLGHRRGDDLKFESVQRRFTKRFPCCRYLTYNDRLVKLNIDSLELRRLRLDLVYVYKQEAQLSLRDRATRACQLKSGKVLHKCRRLVFEKL